MATQVVDLAPVLNLPRPAVFAPSESPVIQVITLSSIAGTVTAEVAVSGTLTTPEKAISGSMDVSVTVGPGLLTGPATEVLIAGDTSVVVSPSGTVSLITVESISGSSSANVTLSGTATTKDMFPAIDGVVSVPVTMSGTLTNLHAALYGSVDIDLYLVASDSDVFTLIYGDTSIVTTLQGDAIRAIPAPVTTSALTLSQVADPAEVETIIGVGVLTTTLETYVKGTVRSPLVIPAQPEPAVPGVIPAAGGILLRALHGVVVDMTTPTITDGKPS